MVLSATVKSMDSGFVFDNCGRNATLAKMGSTGPSPISTGTTIVGLTYKDGVIVGADSRATAGSIIADKKCIKLHRLTNNIFACGAGTAADLDQVARMLSSNLTLMELNTGRKTRVVAAMRLARQHLFRYMGHVGAYLLIGGVDQYGPYLGSAHAHGSGSRAEFMADGSGSLAALGVLDKEYRAELAEADAVALLVRALSAGMAGDLASGNSLSYSIITKDGKREFRGIVPDFCVSSPKDFKYAFGPKSTTVLKQKEIKFEVVEKMDVS